MSAIESEPGYVHDRPANFMVSVVVPAYNECANLETLVLTIDKHLQVFKRNEILVVDDGSCDASEYKLKELSKRFPNLRYILLSRNFGHQNALKAGLDNCLGDLAVSLDADLQHPPELIARMVDAWLLGDDVVCTKRIDDVGTGFLKRLTSNSYYWLINLIGDSHIEPGSADFRLLDRKVLDTIKDITERPIFLRSLVPWLGFKTSWISYTPHQRFQGESKYSVKKMLSLALSGITASTVKPLRFSAYCGFVIAAVACVYAGYAIICKVFFKVPISGWASLAVVNSLIGALQLIMLGVIGEYIGRILLDVKGRPVYVIRENSLFSSSRKPIAEDDFVHSRKQTQLS